MAESVVGDAEDLEVRREPDGESMNDGRALVQPHRRSGDVITLVYILFLVLKKRNFRPTRAVLTLSKSMFNAGCFSLPYAWKLGGLWVSSCYFYIIFTFLN